VATGWSHQRGERQHWADNNKRYTISARQIEANMVVGDPVCKSGISTNTTCGAITVVGRNYTFVGSDGQTRTLTNQTGASVCAIPGDSGGGVVASGRAYGVVSLSNHNEGVCRNASTRLMTFTPIRRIETRLGAVVRTVDPS
jgi:hypothetical protein